MTPHCNSRGGQQQEAMQRVPPPPPPLALGRCPDLACSVARSRPLQSSRQRIVVKRGQSPAYEAGSVKLQELNRLASYEQSTAPPSPCSDRDNRLGCGKRVTFAAEESSLLGYTCEEYDRSPIFVDLSTTPYALFRKDALLTKNPSEASPKRKNKEFPTRSWDGEDFSEALMKERKPNFSGVWRRVEVSGFEELLVFSGVGPKAAKRASLKRPLHIIDHDDDYFRLVIKSGLSKVDQHYIIGDESRSEMRGNASFDCTIYWGDGTGNGELDQIIITSVQQGEGTETLAIRRLSGDGQRLVLTQVVRKPKAGGEAHATHIFEKVNTLEALTIV